MKNDKIDKNMLEAMDENGYVSVPVKECKRMIAALDILRQLVNDIDDDFGDEQYAYLEAYRLTYEDCPTFGEIREVLK